MKTEIEKCKECGEENDSFLLYDGKCYDCATTWFCSTCGDDTNKNELQDGICPDCR